MASIITWASLAAIVVVFFLFLKELNKLRSANKQIEDSLASSDILESLKGTKLETLGDAYRNVINVVTPEGNKSNMPSSVYFSDDNVSRAHKLNLRMLDTAAGTLVGLGLLGTFLGLTIGIAGFDSSNSSIYKVASKIC